MLEDIERRAITGHPGMLGLWMLTDPDKRWISIGALPPPPEVTTGYSALSLESDGLRRLAGR